VQNSTSMKLFASVFVASVLVGGCQSASGDLEARVKKLEDTNAKYADALDFLQHVYAQQKQQQQADERDEPADDARFAVDVASDVAAGQVVGPANACVTIVEAWDFACPFCRKVSSTLENLVKSYNGKVRVVYKNLVVHPEAVLTGHEAGCAAAKQGKFDEFRHAWWDKAYDAYAAARDPSKLGEPTIMAIANDLKLDTAKFKADMDGPECKQHVEGDMTELTKWHVNSTPSFFMNGKPLRWNGQPDSFNPAVDAEIKSVEASGVPCGDYYEKEVIGKGEKQFRSRGDKKPS
jgi:protein-disulfide isomerase